MAKLHVVVKVAIHTVGAPVCRFTVVRLVKGEAEKYGI